MFKNYILLILNIIPQVLLTINFSNFKKETEIKTLKKSFRNSYQHEEMSNFDYYNNY